ncbi:hypothetical protein [Streptomyces coffeae]|uniref:SH3 domain-containing protein n=1 Tax=Streptomyces coffeae TaxID=621382 RepID=A0ABS1NDA2_9ACTN|nr:hypothetical protein [Streptomyces coffeae]MBL1097870.1 hypothetical protein [Streptomyces coffeae]
MRMRTLAAAGITGAALITTLSGGVATAGTPGPAQNADVTSVTASCYKLTARETVNIRAHRKLNATVNGTLPKGKSGCGDDDTGTGLEGQSYRLCGKSNNSWVHLTYGRVSGWIPAYCTTQWNPRP